MNIATDTLKSRDACTDGIADFAATFPNGLDVSGWTPAQQTGGAGEFSLDDGETWFPGFSQGFLWNG